MNNHQGSRQGHTYFQTQIVPYTCSACVTGQADFVAFTQGCLGKVERQLIVSNLERPLGLQTEVLFLTCVYHMMCFLLWGWGQRCPTSMGKEESI